MIAEAIEGGKTHYISLQFALRDAGIHGLTVYWMKEKGLIEAIDSNHYAMTDRGNEVLKALKAKGQ